MCQLEGSKHWKLYSPREEGERLPRHSSANLTQEEVSWGEEVEVESMMTYKCPNMT